MSIINLPAELHRNIRQYGYNPVVNDEELYVMIRQLKPTYSLMSLYDRLVTWRGYNSACNDDHRIYDTYIKDKQITHVSCITNSIRYHHYGNDTNMPTIDNVDVNIVEIPLVSSGLLKEYLLGIQSDPINTVDVINIEGLLEYKHVYVKPRPSVYDYDPKIVSMITELYPSFSLQKEYQKLSIRKRYSDMLDPALASFLTDVDDILSSIFYDLELRQLRLYLNGTLEHTQLSILQYDGDGYYYINDLPHDIFVSIIAFISNSIYVNQYNIIYPAYKLPFQPDIVF